MDLIAPLLDSWDRQCRILEAVAGLVTEETRHALPSPDGWPLDKHLAHIHLVRKYWLSQVAPEKAASLGDSFVDGWETPVDDLGLIKSLLKDSNKAVRDGVEDLLKKNAGAVGGYDHPVLYLQHMIWHEGWHVGLLFLGLRLAGNEPSETWEEANVWGHWRTEG